MNSFREYGKSVCVELSVALREIKEKPGGGDLTLTLTLTLTLIKEQPGGGDTLFVFGHAVFLNAVAMSVADEMGTNMDEAEKAKISALDLGEAEGIAIIDGQACEHLATR